MNMLLDKTALITGAGRGIGSSIARKFHAEGARLLLHYHSSAGPAEELALELGGSVSTFKADLTDPAQAESLARETVARLGRIDILVNNAASFEHGKTFLESSWESYDAEWHGVFGATFHVTKAVAPIMAAQGDGRIVNFVASLLQRPAATYGAHSAAKSAVLGLTRTLARELGPLGINVNAVSPGMTLTDFSSSLPEIVRNDVAAQTPLRRLATPDDVANVVLFYASDLAGFVTGGNIAPDGGLAVL